MGPLRLSVAALRHDVLHGLFQLLPGVLLRQVAETGQHGLHHGFVLAHPRPLTPALA